MMAALTSCTNDEIFVSYSDCKALHVERDNYGNITDYWLELKVNGEDRTISLDSRAYALLCSKNFKADDVIYFEQDANGEYSACRYRGETTTIKLND